MKRWRLECYWQWRFCLNQFQFQFVHLEIRFLMDDLFFYLIKKAFHFFIFCSRQNLLLQIIILDRRHYCPLKVTKFFQHAFSLSLSPYFHYIFWKEIKRNIENKSDRLERLTTDIGLKKPWNNFTKFTKINTNKM